jgi:DNA-binding transcriptional LysR family regulator
MNSRVTLSQLRVFLAAVELGNLTNAAAELEMSQSAVSHALSELERNLGARLLERGRFGAKATVLGEQIAIQTRIMLRAEAAMLEEVAASRGQLKGLIRIASLRSVATHVLPDFIQAFRVLHPEVQFEIQSGEGVAHGVENAVRTARADLGFLAAPLHTDLDSFEFFKDEWVALFSSRNAPTQETATWQDILEQPFLLCNEAGAPTLREYFARHQQILNPAAQVEDDSVILSMVAHGFGVSILARLATLPLPEGVVVRFPPEQLERKIIVAIQPKLKSVVVEAFLEFLRNKSS